MKLFESYVVLIDLILPRLPSKVKGRVEQLEKDLKNVDSQNMEGKVSNTFYLYFILISL